MQPNNNPTNTNQTATTPADIPTPTSPEPETRETIEKPAKQKHTARNVIITVLIVLLVGGGALAIWFFCIYNSPEKALSDAIQNYLSADRLQLDISSTGNRDGKDVNATATIKAEKGSPLSLHTEMATSNVLNTGKSATFTTDSVLDFGNMLYVKFGGLTDSVANILGVSNLSEVTSDAKTVVDTVEAVTGADFDTTALTTTDEVIDGVKTLESTWFGVNLAEIANQIGVAVEQTPIVNGYIGCLSESFENTKLEDYLAFYQAHPFFNVKKYSGNLASSDLTQTAYSVSYDTTKLAEAINDFDNFAGNKAFSTCINEKYGITLDHDHDNYTAADIESSFDASRFQFVLTVNNFDHKLTNFAASYKNDSVDVTSKAAISYPASLNITVPTDYTPLSEVSNTITKVSEYFKNFDKQ